MSAPYVSFTYFWNWLTISAVAAYVQLPTVSVPSWAMAALISSSVMSLLRIATCFVAAAALAGALAAAALAGAVAGALVAGAFVAVPLVAVLPLLQAASTNTMDRASVAIAPRRNRGVRACIRRTLLLGRSARRLATPRTWRWHSSVGHRRSSISAARAWSEAGVGRGCRDHRAPAGVATGRRAVHRGGTSVRAVR